MAKASCHSLGKMILKVKGRAEVFTIYFFFETFLNNFSFSVSLGIFIGKRSKGAIKLAKCLIFVFKMVFESTCQRPSCRLVAV